MPQSELLKRVAGLLDSSGIASMLTGSLASSLQLEPRATHDIDLLVELGVPAVSMLMELPLPWKRLLSEAQPL